MSKSRWILASALAFSGLLGAGVAHAGHGADVQWSVTVGAPLYVQPLPVQVVPGPVYTQPYPAYRGGYPHHRPHGHYPYYREPTYWDRDGDGIPNRYDRVYNPRWDVDGDGIPNRYDRDGRGGYDGYGRGGHWRR